MPRTQGFYIVRTKPATQHCTDTSLSAYFAAELGSVRSSLFLVHMVKHNLGSTKCCNNSIGNIGCTEVGSCLLGEVGLRMYTIKSVYLPCYRIGFC